MPQNHLTNYCSLLTGHDSLITNYYLRCLAHAGKDAAHIGEAAVTPGMGSSPWISYSRSTKPWYLIG